jgi:hypothetical protein
MLTCGSLDARALDRLFRERRYRDRHILKTLSTFSGGHDDFVNRRNASLLGARGRERQNGH